MLGTANNSPLCYFEENLTLPELSGKTGFVQSTLTSMFSSSLTIFLGHGPMIGGFFNHFYIFSLECPAVSEVNFLIGSRSRACSNKTASASA